MKTADLLGVLTIAILTVACAARPPSAHELADREYGQADERLTAVDRFEMRKSACNKAGGVLEVRRSAGRWQPRVAEMNRATCMRRPGAEF